MVTVGDASLTVDDVWAVARDGAFAELSPAAARRIEVAHTAMLAMIRAGDPIYGVTTGFGAAVATPLHASTSRAYSLGLRPV